MMQVTSDQWLSWLSLYFWPLLRVLALISTAPILSERSVPKRVKLGLAMMITFAIAPSLPANDVPVFSFFALWLAVQQILIGIALGFTMQFAFAAVRTAGEIIGLQMGLSFATFVDPASHLNMPVLARIMDMLALLLFLTFMVDFTAGRYLSHPANWWRTVEQQCVSGTHQSREFDFP